MYIALKKAKLKAQYEGQTYELVPSFNFEQEAYERQGNGKCDTVIEEQKILNISILQILSEVTLLLNVRTC